MSSSRLYSSPNAPVGIVALDPDWTHPQPSRIAFRCPVCQKIGCEEFPGADTYVDSCDNRLPNASLTPNAEWVCSDACRSQLMFESASEDEKFALKRVEIALREIREYLPGLRGILQAWTCDDAASDLIKAGSDFRDSLALRRDPNWANDNVAREEVLEQAIRAANHRLDEATMNPRCTIIAAVKGINDPVYPRQASVIDTQWAGETLGSIGHAILDLREAVDGGAL